MTNILLLLAAALSAMIFNIPDSSASTTDVVAEESMQSRPTIGDSCSCVAFRLDDIQDYFLAKSQAEIINTFERNNANLTVGVIGNYYGDDLFMVTLLKEKITRYNEGNSSFLIEVANHGWNHEDFTQFSREEQSKLIRQTNEKILNMLDVRPAVFIPPQNALDNNTLAALLENDIHYVSGNSTIYPPTILHDRRDTTDTLGANISNAGSVLHFPSFAATGDLNDDDTEWLGYSHVATFAAVNASMHELGYAVVTMYPMEFALRNGTAYENKADYDQIRELELLIDDIRAAGFKIVTISEIDQDNIALVPEFSTYSTYAVLAVSVGIVLWFSAKNHMSSFMHGRKHYGNPSL